MTADELHKLLDNIRKNSDNSKRVADERKQANERLLASLGMRKNKVVFDAPTIQLTRWRNPGRVADVINLFTRAKLNEDKPNE
jgi:hypothetical protein